MELKEPQYKVRFNLGRGKNYMKWKIECAGESAYYDPAEWNLFLSGCTLKNNKSAARKIFAGENKNVCAWIMCDHVFLGKNYELPQEGVQLKYNPRVQPNWTADEANVDNEKYDAIWSDGRKLFGKK